MTGGLTIRPVDRTDYDRWLPLWAGYNAFYGRSGDTALAADITRTTWSRFFDAYEPVHGLVAEADGALLGLAHYLLHGAPPRSRRSVTCRTCSRPSRRAAAVSAVR